MQPQFVLGTRFLSKMKYGDTVTVEDYLKSLSDPSLRPLDKDDKPKFIFQFIFRYNRRKYDLIERPNHGLVYVDIDQKHNRGFLSEEIKRLVTQLPFVYMADHSTNGGLHVWCRTDIGSYWIDDSIEEQRVLYNSLFMQISAEILSRFGIVTDEDSMAMNQVANLGYDESPYLNPECSEFKLDFSNLWQKPEPLEHAGKEHYDKNEVGNIYSQIDRGLLYLNAFVACKKTGMPVPFVEGLQFDQNEHVFINHISRQQLETLPFLNEAKTLAYSPEGFNSISYSFNESTRISTKKRTNLYTKFVLDLIHLNATGGTKRRLEIDEKYIYNLIRALNQKYSKSKLSDFYLERIYYLVVTTLRNGTYKWKFKCRKSVTIDRRYFYLGMEEVLKKVIAEKDSKMSDKLKFYLLMLNQAKNRFKVKRETDLLRVYSNSGSRTQLVKQMVSDGISKSTAYEIIKRRQGARTTRVGVPVYEYIKTLPPSTLSISRLETQPCGRSSFIEPILGWLVTASKTELIEWGINEIRGFGNIATQRAVSRITSVNINTVKYHWSKFESKPLPPKSEDSTIEKSGDSEPIGSDSTSDGIPEKTKPDFSFEDRYRPRKFDHEANDKLLEKISKTIREFEVEYARRNP